MKSGDFQSQVPGIYILENSILSVAFLVARGIARFTQQTYNDQPGERRYSATARYLNKHNHPLFQQQSRAALNNLG